MADLCCCQKINSHKTRKSQRLEIVMGKESKRNIENRKKSINEIEWLMRILLLSLIVKLISAKVFSHSK